MKTTLFRTALGAALLAGLIYGAAYAAGSRGALRDTGAQPSAMARLLGDVQDSIAQQQTMPVRVAGRVRHTLYQAARRAGLSRPLTRTLIHIFSSRVNYRHEIHPGDRFVAVYKRTTGVPRLVAAELDLDDQTLRAFRYATGTGGSAFYTAGGEPLKPTLLRAPVDYSRVSSPFSLHRMNPVLHVYRPHYGVDLAAPAGTPVHAAGPGRVTFRGRERGYGKLVIIDNPGPYSTRYGHLSRFAKHVHAGDRVTQGEVIGYVGETGIATGPHLHFEIRVNGKPRPPLKVDLPRDTLNGDKLVAYKQTIAPLKTALDPTPRVPVNVRIATTDRKSNDNRVSQWFPSNSRPWPLVSKGEGKRQSIYRPLSLPAL
jgi:murein DD-endopeptidase MepM/ murein hydrolase activator NlpD